MRKQCLFQNYKYVFNVNLEENCSIIELMKAFRLKKKIFNGKFA